LESDTSLQANLDFLLGTFIETRQLGSAVALSAIPTASAVIKETIEKSLPVDNLDSVIFRLSRCLLDASQPEEAPPFRAAAAASLKMTGRLLVERTYKTAETSRNLFLLILNLIQDEEKDIRGDTAFFLTDLVSSLNSTSPENPRMFQMSPTCCLEEFALHIHHWFPKQHIVPVIFDLLKNCDPVEIDEIQQPLYDREPRNFFQEETESVRFLVKVVKSLASAMECDDNHPFQLNVDVEHTFEEAHQCLDRVRPNLSFSAEANEWLFTQSAESYSVLIRLNARLSIIGLCCPSWETDHRFLELKSLIERMTHRCVS
jgi:hypothetical protein